MVGDHRRTVCGMGRLQCACVLTLSAKRELERLRIVEAHLRVVFVRKDFSERVVEEFWVAGLHKVEIPCSHHGGDL